MSAPAPVPTGAPRGLRREAPILLPLALALFAVLGGVTLAFYRASVARFAAERASEALSLAERLAESLAEETPRPNTERLDDWRRRLPPGAALALVDRDGRPFATSGALDEALPPELLAEALARGQAAADPATSGGPRVVALVRLTGDGGPALLRLDLAATWLAAEQATLRRLTPLVVGLSLATALVVIFFFRALMRPYEALLARARAAAGDGGDAARDDLEFLLSTFDRALATMGAPEGDLAPLAGSLGRSLDGGFLLVDPDRRLLVTTPAAAELLGLASPPAGTGLAEAFAAAPGVAEALTAALDPAAAAGFRTLRLGAGGRAIGFTAEPLRGEGGRLRGWLVVLADRTESERSEARERLAEGLAQLGELSAGVAHELRNGLAALTGWIELARRRPHSAETAECLDEIARESRLLARVVDDFLTFARPGTRRLETCDLCGVARRAASDPVFAPPGVRLELPAAAAELTGDPVLLERAVRNLVANAVEAVRATGGGEPVELSVRPAAATWEITVADRGQGVPAELAERLFQPFVSGRPGGVGLGLALARRIAVLHGGGLRLESRPGGGSRFVLTLPLESSDTSDT